MFARQCSHTFAVFTIHLPGASANAFLCKLTPPSPQKKTYQSEENVPRNFVFTHPWRSEASCQYGNGVAKASEKERFWAKNKHIASARCNLFVRKSINPYPLSSSSRTRKQNDSSFHGGFLVHWKRERWHIGIGLLSFSSLFFCRV